MSDELKTKIDWSCKFSKQKYKIYEGCLRIVEHTNLAYVEPHKGIYGLYQYYCYLLGVFPKKHPKQYLPYSIRKEVYKLKQFSQQVRFMHGNNIVTKEDLDNFANSNNEQLSELKDKRENLWRRYLRAKTEDKKNEILAEINDIQPKIKELNKYDKYCKEITKRAKGIQNNLNNFDKDMQKEKDGFFKIVIFLVFTTFFYEYYHLYMNLIILTELYLMIFRHFLRHSLFVIYIVLLLQM